jgi:hypothetical protein
MAMTIPSAVSRTTGGVESLFCHRVTVNLDNSYPTGGYPAFQDKLRAAAAPAAPTVEAIVAIDAKGLTVAYDRVTDKLKLYRTGATTAVQQEVPNATDLSSLVSIEILVLST